MEIAHAPPLFSARVGAIGQSFLVETLAGDRHEGPGGVLHKDTNVMTDDCITKMMIDLAVSEK